MGRKRQAKIPNHNSGGTQGGGLWRLRSRVFRQVSKQLVRRRMCQAKQDPIIRKMKRAMTAKILLYFPAPSSGSLGIAK